MKTLWIIGLLCSVLTGGSTSELEVRTIDSDIFLGEKFDTGYVSMDPHGELFFWHFPSRGKPDSDPLVFWLAGGPGCSSESALLDENGPFWIQHDATLKKNEHSWNNIANMVWVDQPLGTGFSEARFNYHTTSDGVARDFEFFLIKFLEKYPEYKKRNIYLTGGSYGSHFIPYIALHLVKKHNEDINIQGILIGNGWIDPINQYQEYAEYAKDEGMISSTEYDIYKQGFHGCAKAIESMLWPVAVTTCNLLFQGIIKGKNFYDVRAKCENPPFCVDESTKIRFLNRPDVKRLIGVEKAWKPCEVWIQALLIGDYRKSAKEYVERLLDRNIRVTIYNGEKDFVCNWLGGQRWTNSLNNSVWHKSREFAKKGLQDYNNIGLAKTIEPLTFIKVYDAGHMVSKDKPEAGLQIFNDFVNNKIKYHIEDEDDDLSHNFEVQNDDTVQVTIA